MAASSNVRSSSITINASELASVLNRHRYQPRSETMLKIWQRADARTFCFAKGLEHRNEIATLINEYYRNIQTGKLTKDKEALESILVDKWDQDDESFIQVMKEIFPEPTNYNLFWDLRYNIRKELKALTLRDCKEQKLLDDSHIQKNEIFQEVKKLAENEKKPVSESVKEFCEKKGIKDEEVVKAVESTMTKDRGTKLESKAVEVFGKQNDMQFTDLDVDILQSKQMECDGIKWALQGRADALTQDTVVEVKNRKNRFMVPLPDYDLLQLQAYLFLYNRDIGILLERMNEENKETAVEFDVEQWVNEVVPGMKSFVEELNAIMVKNKERFAEPSLPSLAQESSIDASPLKRSHDDDNGPVKEKKTCQSLDVPVQVAAAKLEQEVIEVSDNQCPVQEKETLPGASDIANSLQEGHEGNKDFGQMK